MAAVELVELIERWSRRGLGPPIDGWGTNVEREGTYL